MVNEEIRHEIHDMSSKIHELQTKQNTLTNGQRYAAINEIEKSIRPLRKDLHHLEHQLYSQESDDKILQEQIDKILEQISDLEDIKSDLMERIYTETEHTRKELNDKIIDFFSHELEPIKSNIKKNQEDIISLKDDIIEFREEINKRETEREIKDAKKFDNLKITLTGVVAIIVALSTLSMWLEPTIKTLLHVFF